MIKLKNISYKIGTKDILKDVSANFLSGKFSMILGPNGSGKSSLLKIFSGNTPATSGTVIYDGANIEEAGLTGLSKCRSVMSQQPELSFPLSVEEVVMMGRYPHFKVSPSANDHSICREVMSKLKINSFEGRDYTTLSGGEKQRVQFARALAQIWDVTPGKKRYLFLDEPLNSLDIKYQQEFLEISRSLLNEDTIIVAVMHDVNLAIQFADELFFLKEGSLVDHGATADILNGALIKNVFGVQVQFINHPVTGLPVMVH